MPIVNASAITALSKGWTHEQVVSEVMALCAIGDNENIQLDNMRWHLNAGLSYISNLLNLAERPWYGMWLSGTYEDSLHVSDLEYVNLATAIANVTINGNANQTIVPSQWIHSIKRMNFNSSNSNTWVGNATKWDISQLTQQSSYQNVQHRFTIAWTHHGPEVLIFHGNNIVSPNRAQTHDDYTVATGNPFYVLWGYRKPILDDMLVVGTSITYRALIDLPDEYIELLVKLIQQKVYTQRKERVPAQLEQEINQGVAQISQQISNEMQYESTERDKVRYGHPQTPPGAM